MMQTDRRHFLKRLARAGLTTAMAPLWSDLLVHQAFAQSTSSYKAIVVITLIGGNDGNNVVIPIDSRYTQYASLRPAIAVAQKDCIPLIPTQDGLHYGLHPSLPNIAALYNSKRALVVSNVGVKPRPGVKADFLNNTVPYPEQIFAHPAGISEWESASSEAVPSSGWGGRIADLLTSASGSLPPLLDVGSSSIFTVGTKVQAVAVRSNGNNANVFAFPAGVQEAADNLAALDSKSNVNVVAASAKLRALAAARATLLDQAQASGAPLATKFSSSPFGQQMNTIANVLKGRDVIGASRQVFYSQQYGFDTHGAQPTFHGPLLNDLDNGIGSLMAAIDEIGLTDRVLIVTLSDFGRTMAANSSAGTDHGWGNHQFVIGGGVRGGRVLGRFPDLDPGGSMDLSDTGIWVPSISVVEMAAGVGSWMGLSAPNLQTVFPTLSGFPAGPLSYL